jgi:hypothetical protein
MNLEEKQQLERDCQAVGIQPSDGVPNMLTQLWALGLKVPPLFMWPPLLAIFYYIVYVNGVFLLFWFLIRNSIAFFLYPNSWVLPVMCPAFTLGALFAALRQLRIKKKIQRLTKRYNKGV